MRPEQRRPRAFWLAVALLTLSVAGACQGEPFNGDSRGGGTGGSAAGEPATEAPGGQMDGAEGGTTNAAAGVAQGGSQSSQSGAAGASGAGGCATNDDCEGGTFCQKGACISCSDISNLDTLEFGEVEPLSVLDDSIDNEGLRFPRPIGDRGLLYVRDFFGGHVWLTSDFEKSVGAPIASIAGAGLFEAGASRPADPSGAPLAAYNFFFHRTLAAQMKPFALYGGVLDDKGQVTGITKLPAPFNEPAVMSSFDLTVSKTRAVWMQNVDNSLNVHLRTVPLPVGDAQASDLFISLPNDCGFASELDFAPWLSRDGRTLFVAARLPDPDCQVSADDHPHLLAVALSELGEPLGIAHPLQTLAAAEGGESDPALTPDGCRLYFTARRHDILGVYRSTRTQ